MSIKPIHDRVAIKRDAKETTTSGGIIIPEAATETPASGTVIATGPGKTDSKGNLLAMQVAVGDSVLFGKFAGNDFKVGSNDVVIVHEVDIIAVIEKGVDE